MKRRWTRCSRHSVRSPRASARSANTFSSSRPYCCCRSPPARSWRMPITTAAASTGSSCTTFCRSTFLRDIHIQAPIIWIGVGWIGAGLFLAPSIAAGREARGQGVLVDALFWVTLIIVAGALIGNWLGIMGYVRGAWFWFGNQGLSYIQLGRFWQIGFFLGLLMWSGLVFRALWPTAAELWRSTR